MQLQCLKVVPGHNTAPSFNCRLSNPTFDLAAADFSIGTTETLAKACPTYVATDNDTTEPDSATLTFNISVAVSMIVHLLESCFTA